MPSHKEMQRVILVPAPPKCASRTFATLLSRHIDAPEKRHKSGLGFGHFLLNVPELGRRERWMQRILPQRQQERLLIYGHYPASQHNLNQLERRYSPAAVVMPVRPLGSLLCSLIQHTRHHHYGPLDLRCPGLRDGIPGFDQRSESDLFYLLAIFYLPKIHLIIQSWFQTTKKKNIPLFYVPFESITKSQTDLLIKLNKRLPKDFRSTKQLHQNAKPVKVNISTMRKIMVSDIESSQREAVETMASQLFGGNNKLRELLPYLLSDLRAPGQQPSTPIIWNFNKKK